jgi:hypothetical protein
LSTPSRASTNLIGLGTALAFTVLSGTLLPIIVAAGIEMVVLPLVSGSGRFQRLVRARTSEEEDEQDAARNGCSRPRCCSSCPRPRRARYRMLQASPRDPPELQGHGHELADAPGAAREKLDFLLSFYLRMRYSLTPLPQLLQQHRPRAHPGADRDAGSRDEVGSRARAADQGPTRSVLEKRLDRYKKALENRDLIDAQTETVQEVLQLLRDQSYSMRDPRSITDQIDGLVSSAEETERGVKDMEEILAMENDLMSPGSLEADIEQELQASRSAPISSAPAAPVRARVPPPPGSPPPPPARS